MADMVDVRRWDAAGGVLEVLPEKSTEGVRNAYLPLPPTKLWVFFVSCVLPSRTRTRVTGETSQDLVCI